MATCSSNRGNRSIRRIYPSSFKIQLDRIKLVCHICEGILDDPVGMTCGCIYCEGCTVDYMRDQKEEIQCPTCEQIFTDGSIVIQRSSRRDVNNAIVFCPNKEAGCMQEMKYQDVYDHLEQTCPFVACCYVESKIEYGCQVVLPRKELQSHTDQCVFYPPVCCVCGQMIATAPMKEHQKKCKIEQLPCPNNCKLGGKMIHPYKMADHMTVCPLEVVECDYKDSGCTYKCKRKDMKRHIKSEIENHLLKVSRHVKNVEMEFKVLKRKVERVEDQFTGSENKKISLTL